MPSLAVDARELAMRIAKYLVEGLVVATVAALLPSKSLRTGEVIILALTAATIFSILDLLAPSMGAATRTGLGYGAGFGLIGFP